MEIVATLGPSSFHLASELRSAGASAFRLNASHMSATELAGRVSVLCRFQPRFPVVVDLQGAKMRLGEFAQRPVEPGDRIVFSLDLSDEAISLPHPELFGALAAGDTLTCDDARLRFRVLSVSTRAAEVRPLDRGVLKPRKGINIAEHPVALLDLTAHDRACVEAAAAAGARDFAFSFMTDGREAAWVRRAAPGCTVTGKIEREEALSKLGEIETSVDSLWICRGDLGAQLGPARLSRWVSGVKPGDFARPILMAGQVLEHMTRHATPTRSEICHLFDLVSRGYAGFVLSDETAVGVDPVCAVRVLREFLGELED
jgi:pyruvate kinase